MMKLYSKLLIFSAVLILVATLSGCSTRRSLIKAPLKEEGAAYLFEKLQANQFKFQSFSAKLTLGYKAENKLFEFKGQIRMVKDSVIWLTFTQDLGIEMARILITQDSVKFMDRINKEYFAGDYTFVNNFLKTNIDFGILQGIILGNDFEYYENVQFKAMVDGNEYHLMTDQRSKLKKYVRNSSDENRIFFQSIWLNPSTFKISQIKLKELTKDSKKLTARYSDFEMIEGQLFPLTLKYELETLSQLQVSAKYSKIELNKSLSFPFKIPSNYDSIK
jgi:hypothetical protein